MRANLIVSLLLVLHTQPDFALNLIGGADKELTDVSLRDRSWSKRTPIATHHKAITLSDFYRDEKLPDQDEIGLSQDKDSLAGHTDYGMTDSMSQGRGSVPVYGVPDDNEPVVWRKRDSSSGYGTQDDSVSTDESAVSHDAGAITGPVKNPSGSSKMPGGSTAGTLNRGEGVVAQMAGKRRNRVFFCICVVVGVAMLCFTLLKFVNRAKPDKPPVAGAGEQSTLMSEMFPRTPNRWERRGVILGIVLSLSALSGLALNAVAMHPIYGNLSHWTRCDAGGPFGINWWEAQFCTYVSAYIWTAPQLTLVVALLLFGRGLLQQRLYYAMLKNAGGVLDYHRSTALGDPLFLLLMFWYAHSLLYLGFLGYLIVVDQPDKTVQDKDRQTLTYFLLYAFIPFTLFVVFTFTKYSLELYLVPLSEFVDADEGQKNLLSGLRVIDESTARDVLMESCKMPSPLNQEATDKVKYATTMQLCLQAQKEKGNSGSHPSHLLNYLWPSIILTSRKTLGNNAALFRIVWWIYLALAVLLLVASIVFLTFCCYQRAMTEQFLFLPAAVIQIGVLAWTLGAFLKTATQR